MLVVILIIVAIVSALAVWFITLYNNILTTVNRSVNASHTIDAQLQRPHDLMPNVVNTV